MTEASILGVQRSRDRFGKRDREETPPIARWRCNLTGLSQRQNLLFMAFTGQIFVYQPHFPSQALPSKPALVIDTTPSRPGLAGTLDPRNPRAINYLVIQDLGLKEILAVARDDGDVEAYYVAHVVNAVERCAAGEVANVGPFWQSNVGLSAWGLAIHSSARIIAASSNTHNITIFKFGLIEADAEGGISGDSTRLQDVTQTIVNGTTNIPCICFCNTGDDPNGRWLLTTDILGDNRTIDLQRMQVVQTFSFEPSGWGRRVRDDFHYPGWTIMFLDRQSFEHAETSKEALGRNFRSALVPRSHKEVWEISGKHLLTQNERKFSIYKDNESDSNLTYDSVEEFLSSRSGIQGDSRETVLKTNPTRTNEEAPFCGDLPCPALHTSVCCAYLLQPGDRPMVGFTDVLHQPTGHAFAGLNEHERLNMTAYIPSIGVLILASQKGRAIVLSLNKLLYDSKTTYTMRIDGILPYGLQERRNERPFMPLLGIAVGPIQGTEQRGDQQRWRLFMTYADHTVFSYEIKRSRSEDSTRDESVIV